MRSLKLESRGRMQWGGEACLGRCGDDGLEPPGGGEFKLRQAGRQQPREREGEREREGGGATSSFFLSRPP